GRLRRLVLTARKGVLDTLVVDRRGDDRRHLAGRLRTVPRRLEAETRPAGEAAFSGGHPERHGQPKARRDAVVRRLRNALLPHRPAQEVRLQETAGVLDPAVPDGEEDPGRRARDEPELQRLRVPG